MTERGKWMLTALKRAKKAHLMCDDERTFCGRTLVHRKPADTLGEWVPEDHVELVCPICMAWWTAMKPKHPAPHPQQPA